MIAHPRTGRAPRALAALAVCALGLTVTAGPASAAEPAASAFGTEVSVSGTDVVPPTPTASVDAPTGDDSDVVVDVPADPVVVNGTLTATAAAHTAADIASALTVVSQDVAGPYNATAVGEVEDLGLVYDVAGQDVPLVSAALVRAEAAVVCGATPTYTAASEIVDLAIAGTDVPLNTPVQDLIDAITGALADSGLNAVVDVQRNVVSDVPGGGIGVDALVVTILAAAGDTPLATVRIAHAEVTASACVAPPQCSDSADNDGDAAIDSADPGCHTDGDAANAGTYDPADDDETDVPECSDTRDNDGDAAIDSADPGCHTDGNAGNAGTYDPLDDDETDAAALAAGQLPRTGTSSTTALAGIAVLGLGLGALTLRRRLVLG